MITLAVCSVGRRVELVRQLVEGMAPEIEVIAIDRDPLAPALKAAPLHCSSSYMPEILDGRYDYVISLHDDQLHQMYLSALGIDIILHSSPMTVILCRDKARMGELGINTPPTMVIKPRRGSNGEGMVKQPYIEGTEYNIQAYYDIHTTRLIDVFMQEKLRQRQGETERGKSVWIPELLSAIDALDNNSFRGPVDIDVIVDHGKVYVLDINPRFGGGYPLAHHCGVDFIRLLKRNILGEKMTLKRLSQYECGVIMSKYPATIFTGGRE